MHILCRRLFKTELEFNSNLELLPTNTHVKKQKEILYTNKVYLYNFTYSTITVYSPFNIAHLSGWYHFDTVTQTVFPTAHLLLTNNYVSFTNQTGMHARTHTHTYSPIQFINACYQKELISEIAYNSINIVIVYTC